MIARARKPQLSEKDLRLHLQQLQDRMEKLGYPRLSQERLAYLLATIDPRLTQQPASKTIIEAVRHIDGRTLRKTNRTVSFNQRITPEADQLIRHIAQRDGLLIGEVIEKAIAAYEATRTIMPTSKSRKRSSETVISDGPSGATATYDSDTNAGVSSDRHVIRDAHLGARRSPRSGRLTK